MLPTSDGGTKHLAGGKCKAERGEARKRVDEVDAKVVQVCAPGMVFVLHQILLASESSLCSCQILAEDLAPLGFPVCSFLINIPYFFPCFQFFSIFQFCREIETSTKKIKEKWITKNSLASQIEFLWFSEELSEPVRV